MAELAASSIGTTAATAAPAAASGTQGFWNLSNLTSLGLTLASGGLQVASGNQQAASLKAQQRQAELEARQELTRGKQVGNQLRERLLATDAAQNAMFGASGLDMGSGTPADLAATARAEVARELEMIRTNADLRAGSARSRAGEAGRAAGAARQGGAMRGGVSIFDFVDRLERRGAFDRSRKE
jgi:hypothetical protein